MKLNNFFNNKGREDKVVAAVRRKSAGLGVLKLLAQLELPGKQGGAV